MTVLRQCEVKVDPIVKTEKRLLRCIISSCLLFIVLPK